MTTRLPAPVASVAGIGRCVVIDHIKLSAYEGNADWRIGRLNQYIGVLMGKALMDKELDILQQIEALHDHKGVLSVLWRSEPSSYSRRVADRAWAFFDDPEPEHFTLRDKEKYPEKYPGYSVVPIMYPGVCAP